MIVYFKLLLAICWYFRPSFIIQKYTLYFESNTNINILLIVFETNQIDLSKFINLFFKLLLIKK